MKKHKREEVFTCAYQMVCDCGNGLLCEHPKNYEDICALDDKKFKCPLGLIRNWRKNKKKLALPVKEKE